MGFVVLRERCRPLSASPCFFFSWCDILAVSFVVCHTLRSVNFRIFLLLLARGLSWLFIEARQNKKAWQAVFGFGHPPDPSKISSIITSDTLMQSVFFVVDIFFLDSKKVLIVGYRSKLGTCNGNIARVKQLASVCVRSCVYERMTVACVYSDLSVVVAP